MNIAVLNKDKQAFGLSDNSLLDLRFGNPAFLQPYWGNRNNDITVISGTNMGYVSAMGNERLKKSIAELHDSVGNAETKDYHIIVGTGASQVIQAALHALNVKNVKAQAPYFPRFPVFAELNGLSFNSSESNSVEIVTCPNNPDNKLNIGNGNGPKIYDYCYNWPQYVDSVIKGKQDIMVFSLAKATGHAATRIGWALVKDKALADEMDHYIEMSTSGVSHEAQVYATNVIRSQLIDFKGTCFKHGKDKLTRRWDTFREHIKPKADIKVLNSGGMFAWCKCDAPDANKYMQDRYSIVVISGSHFGADDSYFRMNLGSDLPTFEKLLEKLK